MSPTAQTPDAKRPSTFKAFLENSSSGGLVLMAMALAALIIANSPLYPAYQSALSTYVGGLSILHWINDALMAVFFLLVGLEIKREVLEGQLSTWSARLLPGFAAVGGMALPAAIYLFFNGGDNGHPSGWAIPAATDIAFALAVLSLLGSRVPLAVKVLLTAVAVIDDLLAVAVIAVFYTSEIDAGALGIAAAIIAALVALNRLRVASLAPYLLLGAALWYFVLQSGVHATLAGVVLAFIIPMRKTGDTKVPAASPLLTLEHAIAPWVTFLIVPIFGFANAGVAIPLGSLSQFGEPIPLGIMAALVIGKQAGVFLFLFATIRLGFAKLPSGTTWLQLYGMALLCGIGFTMSLFIGLLAFPDAYALQDQAKLGILAGSLVSALGGAAVLAFANRRASPGISV